MKVLRALVASALVVCAACSGAPAEPPVAPAPAAVELPPARASAPTEAPRASTPATAEPARERAEPSAPAEARAEPTSGVPGANLRVGSITADGVTLTDVSCKLDGVGLLGAMVVVGTLAQQKAALASCGLETPTPIAWTIRSGSVSEASAESGDAKRDACVVRALKRVHGTSDGACRAKVSVPKK